LKQNNRNIIFNIYLFYVFGKGKIFRKGKDMESNKKFSLFSAILSVICVVFVAEAAAPVAAIGNSQFFWWLFLLIAFLLPYGLISSELGTTYIGDGLWFGPSATGNSPTRKR